MAAQTEQPESIPNRSKSGRGFTCYDNALTVWLDEETRS